MAAKKRKAAKKKSGGSGALKIAALTAATAAGVYFLYGSKDAKKNRKKAEDWAMKAKGEVLGQITKAKSLKEEDYKRMVDTVTNKYKKLKTTKNKDVEALAREMKAQWKQINKQAAKKMTTVKKVAKKTAKKVGVKKAAKKAPKKAAKRKAKKK